jgi:hypothetical protein
MSCLSSRIRVLSSSAAGAVLAGAVLGDREVRGEPGFRGPGEEWLDVSAGRVAVGQPSIDVLLVGRREGEIAAVEPLDEVLGDEHEPPQQLVDDRRVGLACLTAQVVQHDPGRPAAQRSAIGMVGEVPAGRRVDPMLEAV